MSEHPEPDRDTPREAHPSDADEAHAASSDDAVESRDAADPSDAEASGEDADPRDAEKSGDDTDSEHDADPRDAEKSGDDTDPGHDADPRDAEKSDDDAPEAGPQEAGGDEDAEQGPPPLARFEDLTKSYGPVQALGPLTLDIDGDVVGLLGPNGAGKSTLIRLMLGLLPPTTGSLQVLGQDVTAGSRALRQRIGYAPEGDTRFPHLTGIESVAYAGRLMGMRPDDAMQRAHQVLDYVDLGESRYRNVDNYSTGMRQRLKLAQALVHDPDLLILDEPTEGVDPRARDDILSLIEELAKVHGIRVILSTHILADVERLATHALILDAGKVVAQGSVAELRRAGRSGYVVRVAGDLQPLQDHLDQEGVPWHPLSSSIRVELDDPKQVLRHVAASGSAIRHLEVVQLRLDEAFEQALGGGADA